MFLRPLRALTLALVMAAPAIVAAQSQPPSPGPTEGRQPEQSQARNDRPQATDNSEAPNEARSQATAAIGQGTGAPDCEGIASRAADCGQKETSPDWWMVRLTAVLAFAAIVQIVVYATQSVFMYDAARTARLSARALADLERPWLIVEPAGDPEPREGPTPDDPRILYSVDYKITNLGRSPAWIISAGVECRCVPYPVPENLPYPDQGTVILPASPIRPGGVVADYGALVNVSDGTRESILRGTAAVVLVGLLKYRDSFKNVRSTGFCWVFLRPARGLRQDQTGSWVEWTGWEQSEWITIDGPESYIRNT